MGELGVAEGDQSVQIAVPFYVVDVNTATQQPIMEDASSFLVDSDPPWQIPYSPPIREEPGCVARRDAEGRSRRISTAA